MPDKAARKYLWKHGPMQSKDEYGIETDINESGIQQVCIEEGSHLGHGSVAENHSTPEQQQDARSKRDTNELLKHLPRSVHDAIHQSFILMWMTGNTPDSWKKFDIIL